MLKNNISTLCWDFGHGFVITCTTNVPKQKSLKCYRQEVHEALQYFLSEEAI